MGRCALPHRPVISTDPTGAALRRAGVCTDMACAPSLPQVPVQRTARWLASGVMDAPRQPPAALASSFALQP